MISPYSFISSLKNNGISFFTGVPDSLLKNFCACVTSKIDSENHIIAANEGNAIGLAIGYHLATGQVPLIYLQNSGLGNVINPLLSLADQDVYSIPMILIIGWRGEYNTKDEPQHKKQGRVTTQLLEAMEIPYIVITPETVEKEIEKQVALVAAQCKENKSSYAILVKKGSFEPFEDKVLETSSLTLSREDAIKTIINQLPGNSVVISTTGVASRELFEYREARGEGHEKDFLTVGGMGHASQIALSVALQRKERKVVCLDGDGAFLMHMGAAGINGAMQCENFYHIVLNNGCHDSVGGQPTVGFKINIPEIARATNYNTVLTTDNSGDLDKKVAEIFESRGPSLLEVKVKKGFRRDLGRPTLSPVENKENFMRHLKV